MDLSAWHIAARRIGATAIALTAAAAAAQAYEAPGPYAVTVIDVRWPDPRRDRAVPLRIRLPDAAGARPLILFSHGLGGSIDGGRAWGEHWASHGFAVIDLQHPGSDESVWKDAPRPGDALRAAADARQLLARVEDVKFVLDELERRAAAGEPVATRIDLQRIGVSGHSFGAITTQAIAGQDYGRAARGFALADHRPRAFIAFSPSARSRSATSQFAPIERPFLGITGTADGRVGPGLGVVPALRRVPYEGMPAGAKYLLVLDGADHMFFGGGELCGASDPQREQLHARLTRATTTAFWLAHLAGDGDARRWLADASRHIGAAGEFLAK